MELKNTQSVRCSVLILKNRMDTTVRTTRIDKTELLIQVIQLLLQIGRSRKFQGICATQGAATTITTTGASSAGIGGNWKLLQIPITVQIYRYISANCLLLLAYCADI